MDYTCKHCGVNLDDGDIFEHFLVKYMNYTKALNAAKQYGWSETNKIHFNRSVIVQPDNSPQYVICPHCKNKSPFKNEMS